MAAATGPAATSASCAPGDRPSNRSARMPASGRWNGAGNANGAGEEGMAGAPIFPEGGLVRGSPESHDELAILIHRRRCAYIQPVLRWADDNVRELECGEIGEHYW